jgi:TolB-like protein
MGNSKRSIQIDLNEFKLHLHLRNRPQRTLHFDSPSRRFYLCVIALVVHEMKRSGKIKSIPIMQHLDLLALLNETIGGAAGSSDRENLLHRIYRKWKDALPNLEAAPLFKVLGKKKEEEGAVGKVYSFTDAEKDDWANLFEYTGSHENVRLRFSMDKMGIGLGETSIHFDDAFDGDAWERFIAGLKKESKERIEPEKGIEEHGAEKHVVAVPPTAPPAPDPKRKITWLKRYSWALLVVAVVALAGVWGIWRVYLSTGIKAVSVNPLQEIFPDRPSIAILPFVNMNGDPRQEYFSDGITEDIITNLSKIATLTVISRNSTFLYKGKQIKIEEVARDLGVRHILEGSVRREEGRVRINAQLIDGRTGRHVWADQYDRDLKDIFSVQDEVTQKVISELSLALTTIETEYVYRKYTKNFEAYDMFLRARETMQFMTKENQFKAIELSKRVIDLDPHFAGGYQNLSFLLSRGIKQGWSESPQEDLEKAFELAKKAISVDDKFPLSYMALASVYLLQGKHDNAVAAMNRGVMIAPGDSITVLWLGAYLHWAGRGEEAVAAIKKSMDLNPLYLSGKNPTYLDYMGMACFTAGRYAEAFLNIKKAIEKYGSLTSRDPFLIASYSMLDRMDEARGAARQWLKANQTFSLSSWDFGRLYKSPEDIERLYGALRKAGLK